MSSIRWPLFRPRLLSAAWPSSLSPGSIPPLFCWSACFHCSSPTSFFFTPQLQLQILQSSQVSWGLSLAGVRIDVLPVGKLRSRKMLSLPQTTKPGRAELGPNHYYSDFQSEFCLLPVPHCLKHLQNFWQYNQSCLHFHSVYACTGLRRKGDTGSSGRPAEPSESLMADRTVCSHPEPFLLTPDLLSSQVIAFLTSFWALPFTLASPLTTLCLTTLTMVMATVIGPRAMGTPCDASNA